MEKKVIFIDVDGTLLNECGVIPESTKIAIQETRKNGNMVFLATGRAKSEVFDNILEVGFDGMVCCAGANIYINEKEIANKVIEKESLEFLINYFKINNIDFYLQSSVGLIASENCKSHLLKISSKNAKDGEEVLNSFIESLKEEKNLIRDDINKVIFLDSKISIDNIIKDLSSKFDVIPATVASFGKNSGEISVKGVHKALGISEVLDYLGIPNKNTYAYGDGSNDFEMLEYVEHGIAMKNGSEKLKEIANDIAESPEDDGIYKSFKKYGLIK